MEFALRVILSRLVPIDRDRQPLRYGAQVIQGYAETPSAIEKGEEYETFSRWFEADSLGQLTEELLAENIDLLPATQIESGQASLSFEELGNARAPVSVDELFEFRRAYINWRAMREQTAGKV
jgi:hypothetical protein